MLISTSEAATLLEGEGARRFTMAQLDRRLDELGYKREPGAAIGPSEWLTGPNRGLSYVNGDYAVTHKATRLSAYHYAAPRDSNFAKLQDLRGVAFVVSGGMIWTI